MMAASRENPIKIPNSMLIFSVGGRIVEELFALLLAAVKFAHAERQKFAPQRLSLSSVMVSFVGSLFNTKHLT